MDAQTHRSQRSEALGANLAFGRGCVHGDTGCPSGRALNFETCGSTSADLAGYVDPVAHRFFVMIRIQRGRARATPTRRVPAAGPIYRRSRADPAVDSARRRSPAGGPAPSTHTRE